MGLINVLQTSDIFRPIFGVKCYWYVCRIEKIIRDLLKIMKRMCPNFKKILKKCSVVVWGQGRNVWKCIIENVVVADNIMDDIIINSRI